MKERIQSNIHSKVQKLSQNPRTRTIERKILLSRVTLGASAVAFSIATALGGIINANGETGCTSDLGTTWIDSRSNISASIAFCNEHNENGEVIAFHLIERSGIDRRFEGLSLGWDVIENDLIVHRLHEGERFLSIYNQGETIVESLAVQGSISEVIMREDRHLLYAFSQNTNHPSEYDQKSAEFYVDDPGRLISVREIRSLNLDTGEITTLSSCEATVEEFMIYGNNLCNIDNYLAKNP